MFNGIDNKHHAKPRCVIVEEPAQKQLRFRYPCEGRSAGSIPGTNSTPENKTYPTIKVEGYKGKAIVVVSCVTKDEPYRPHPHHLVGREGCKKGVCTVQIPEDTMTVSFQNLGIQCVKKKDIEEALKTREEIRVDPFRTGFGHRNQPTSLDLNAVRLCFQVFLTGETRGKYIDLAPVVSTPIYDRKSMCDLVIVKLSDCVCPVDGGNKDIILLCEKISKEDIQIRFFEEKNNEVVWEGFGEFQPSQVHKQTAIWFRPPKYKTLDVIEPVKMFIQLRRPSDNATSAPVPFQMVALGRPSIWSLRPIAKKRNYDIFSEILSKESQFPSKRTAALLQDLSKQAAATLPKSSVAAETQTIDLINAQNGEETQEKEEQEVIDKLTELDELYTQNKARAIESTDIELSNNNSNSFDDTKSYTSLQLAFKNPIDITITDEGKYEDVALQNPPVDTIPSAPEEEKLPPLPPKRARKFDNPKTCSAKVTDINDPSPVIPATRVLTPEKIDLTIPPRSKSFSVTRPKSQSDLSPPSKDLPPTPCSTLPKPKKRKFFSGLMSYLSKSANASREATPTARSSVASANSLFVSNKLNRSTSNITHHSSASIHIPLKCTTQIEDDLNQNKIDTTDCNILADTFDLNLDLTEAEHYALYTALAPHATQSEFDEASCYYAPVEGGNKRRAERTESTRNKRMLLELEQCKNIPVPDIFGASMQMNIPPMQPVKDEPDLSRSPFLVDQPYQVYQPQMPFQNIPSTSTAQPVPLPSFDAAWGGACSSYGVGMSNIPMVQDTTTTFIDMDSLKQITINSDDLPVTSLTNMSLTDIPPDGMTDSLERLTNHEFDRHLRPHS